MLLRLKNFCLLWRLCFYSFFCFFFTSMHCTVQYHDCDVKDGTDSWHLPHPTCFSCPEGGSQFHESTAESRWSEVTILGHSLNGSHKNRLHSHHLLLRSTHEREGGYCMSTVTLLHTKGICLASFTSLITKYVFYMERCKRTLHSTSIKTHLGKMSF